MSATNYNRSLDLVLRDEGGYTNHPADRGGPTNWGITIADARMYWKKNVSIQDMKTMPLSVAKDIYRVRYWDAQQCNNLPPGVDYAIFDYGVNSGVARSGKVLRRCLGLSDKTWIVTPEVVAAALAMDPVKLCNMIWSERLAFLRGLKTWPVFGKGWGRRVANGRVTSQMMIRGMATVIANKQVNDQPAKGVVPLNTKAQTSTIIVTAGVGGSGAATSPNPWIAVAVIVAMAAVAVGVFYYFKYRQKKAQEAPVKFITEE